MKRLKRKQDHSAKIKIFKINKNIKAENDLVNIWLYSFKQWGEHQADLYLDEIGHCIDSLADNLEIG